MCTQAKSCLSAAPSIIDPGYISGRIFLDWALFEYDVLSSNTGITWNGGNNYDYDLYIGDDYAFFLDQTQIDVYLATGIEGTIATPQSTSWILLFELGIQLSNQDGMAFLIQGYPQTGPLSAALVYSRNWVAR